MVPRHFQQNFTVVLRAFHKDLRDLLCSGFQLHPSALDPVFFLSPSLRHASAGASIGPQTSFLTYIFGNWSLGLEAAAKAMMNEDWDL